MRDIGAFSEPIVAGYILQILHGLLFLHTQSIVHRDIKASNVLVTNSDEIKRKFHINSVDAGDKRNKKLIAIFFLSCRFRQ